MSYLQIFLLSLASAGGVAGLVLSEQQLMDLHGEAAAGLARVQATQDEQLLMAARLMHGGDASIDTLVAAGYIDQRFTTREMVDTAPPLPATDTPQ